MKGQKSNVNDYTWLDEEAFIRAGRAVNIIVNSAKQFGAKWKREWFDKLRRSGLEEIRKECFDDVCKELGFEPVEHTAIGVTTYMAVTDDEALVARVEVNKRLRPIDKTYKALCKVTEFPLSGWLITNNIARHLSEVISVDEHGAPYLPEDYEDRLHSLCTHEIPENWRGLCDIVRDNAQTFHALVEELKKLNFPIPQYLLSLKDGSDYSNNLFTKCLGL